MIVVNLFGVPSAGKSTGAAYVFSQLKLVGVNAELVTEYAKDKVWEESKEVFNNQVYIFGKQFFRISRCAEKVDVIVTDSPLLLSIFYNKSEIYKDFSEDFNNLVLKVFNSYDSMNYLLNRVKTYNPVGRFQTEEESDALGLPLIKMLNKYGVDYTVKDGSRDGYDEIVNEVLSKLRAKENVKDEG